MKRFLIQFIMMISFSLAIGAFEIEVLKAPKNSFCYTDDSLFFHYKINESISPLELILSHIDGPNIKGGELLSFETQTKAQYTEDQILTIAEFILEIKVTDKENITISPITFTFINSQGTEQTVSTSEYSYVVKKAYKKYILLVIVISGIFILMVGFVILSRVIKKRKTQDLKKDQEIKFKELKISAEQDTLKELQKTSQLLISGENHAYCLKIIDALNQYFTRCHPEKPFRIEAPHFFEDIRPLISQKSQSKVNQLFEKINEIQYMNVSPTLKELDRIKELSMELIKDHREFYQT